MPRIPMSETRKGVIALIVLAWVFASMGVFARYLGTEFALFEQTYLRIGLAFFLGILIFAKDLSWKKFRTLPRKDVIVLALRAITLYIGVVLFTEGVLHTKYANASLIAALPLLPLLGYIFLKERLGARTLLYIGVGFIGTFLIAASDLASFRMGYGEMMAFFSLLAFDLSYVARRWHSEHLSDKESAVFMFGVGALFLFATSMAVGESIPSASDFTPILIGTLVVAALFNVANLYLTNYGFKRVAVGIAGNLIALETVFALVYGAVLFQETLVLRELLGGALVLLSVYLINRNV